MLQFFKNLHNEESGQDLIEYVLIAAVLSVVAIAGSTALVTAIDGEWTKIAAKLT
jgi:Flp pilus assembly pilin Flp